ncbi:DUF1904 family protein [Mycoplasma yeatsii]|uniref:DUF1904 domain-containing protein n=3 Tax=Mycoplasma yeatsii TaxID=51365 RepID=S6G6X4_9MOLU|nr:DUF1904 family protein [Mycoplasma yeatsii]EOA07278.1 Hypothetical protein MYEA_3430 [Mycoplasma yeatsii 13926]MDQ0567748.1 hypothetical protein [Mycoplasma yeatsii]
MPIIKFSGVSEERVKEFSNKVNEIAELVTANPENIMFICEDSKVFQLKQEQKPIYVTVEWLSRPDKEQIFANYIVDFFKEDSSKVWIFFTDVNGKLYAHTKKVG